MARKRHLLRQFLALAVGAALLAAPAAAAEEAAPGGQEPVLAICTTGNLAGRVYRQDPLTGGAAEAGFLNAASAAAQSPYWARASACRSWSCQRPVRASMAALFHRAKARRAPSTSRGGRSFFTAPPPF